MKTILVTGDSRGLGAEVVETVLEGDRYEVVGLSRSESDRVEEAAVIGVEDEEYGEMVTAVVHRSDPDLTADDLDEWCLASDELARYERPREYRFTDESLPRTATGKLDRTSLVDGS